MQPTQLLRRRIVACQSEVVQQPLGAGLGSEQAEIANGGREQYLEEPQVTMIVVRHHDGDGVTRQGSLLEYPFWPRRDDGVRLGKPVAAHRSSPRIDDGDVPP
jgi:hypothetical protein